MDPITLVVSVDRNFAKQLAVVLIGISRLAVARPHRVFVLHDGYEPSLMDRVARSASPDVELRWVDARAPILDEATMPPELPIASLFRLRMP